MKSIFEELDLLLQSINEDADPQEETVTVKLPPINPDMETADQGIDMARQKVVKYFYNLRMEGGGGGMMRNDDIQLPDDWLDPKLKGKMDNYKDKTFQKNRVAMDMEELERLKKEIEVYVSGSEDDFDDFDYRDNDFGDDADTSELENNSDGGGGGSSDSSDYQSEKDRLQDAINNAIDKLKTERGEQSGQQQGGQQQGGQQQGGQQGGQQQGGQQQGGQQQGGQQGSQSQGGQQGGMNGGQSYGQGGAKNPRDKMLDDLRDAIGSGDENAAENITDRIKEGEDGSGGLAGQQISNVSDDALKSDMSKAGMSDKDIEEMQDMKEEDGFDGVSKEDLREMRREIVKGLEKKCAKKGGSALAKNIVRSALKQKIDDDAWRNMLKLFLKSKAHMKGEMGKSKNGIKWGHKNHLWRDAVLPSRAQGHGQIQNIYCIIDFSGSVNQDLVFTFLGKVIDLCSELNYTDTVVYGLGSDKISLPTKITARMLKAKGKDVVLSQTWDFINTQKIDSGGTNFAHMTPEVLDIVKRERDAVFLVFGDAKWSESETLPLRDDLGERICDQICMLLYYKEEEMSSFANNVAVLREIVGLKNIITSKASAIKPI